MARVFVGLGSNLGDRPAFLSRALQEIRGLQGVTWRRSSAVYETEPVGKKDQPAFLNMVVELEVEGEPAAFLRSLKAIEARIGRVERERWGPREIDLDLLYFGAEVINDGPLRLPHPELAHRRFVLVPLREIAPDFVDPMRKQSVQDLLRTCPDTGAVRKTQLTVP